MNNIILASHGDLAKGMKQTVEMIIGKNNNIFAISAFRDEDLPAKVQIQNILNEVGYEQTYLITDILGGSVNNDLLEIQRDHSELTLLTGMNLALVISIALATENMDENKIEIIIEESREGIVNCKKLLKENIMMGENDL